MLNGHAAASVARLPPVTVVVLVEALAVGGKQWNDGANVSAMQKAMQRASLLGQVPNAYL